MTTQDIIDKTSAHVLATYGRRPLAFTGGHDATLIDMEGNEYLDFASGLGVNALGYGHPAVAEIVTAQASGVFHTSNLYHIPAQAILAEKLCNASFGERVFFCNSGAESVEAALKFARKWGKQFAPAKTDFIAFENSFHGRTFGSLSATMQEKHRKGFDPLMPGFTTATFNDIASVVRAITPATAAVILEPLQGEGGVNMAESGFLRALETLCHERDILLIADEVQCGMGRTGKLFAHEHAGIVPDIMTLAKPLAGGLPIGATVVGPRVWPHIKPGEHASTFGGNHFVTGVACGVFDIIADPAFLAAVAARGEYLKGRLEDVHTRFACVKQIKGRGLLAGIEVDFPAMEAVEYFERAHILICPAGPAVIRFIPPLIVTEAEIDRVVKTLEMFLTERDGAD